MNIEVNTKNALAHLNAAIAALEALRAMAAEIEVDANIRPPLGSVGDLTQFIQKLQVSRNIVETGKLHDRMAYDAGTFGDLSELVRQFDPADFMQD